MDTCTPEHLSWHQESLQGTSQNGRPSARELLSAHTRTSVRDWPKRSSKKGIRCVKDGQNGCQTRAERVSEKGRTSVKEPQNITSWSRWFACAASHNIFPRLTVSDGTVSDCAAAGARNTSQHRNHVTRTGTRTRPYTQEHAHTKREKAGSGCVVAFGASNTSEQLLHVPKGRRPWQSIPGPWGTNRDGCQESMSLKRGSSREGAKRGSQESS